MKLSSGKRDCLLIATTDQPERFDGAVYRRFVEKGSIINISDYWTNPENLKEVVSLELLRNDILVRSLNRTRTFAIRPTAFSPRMYRKRWTNSTRFLKNAR
jgi:hypothetical protein